MGKTFELDLSGAHPFRVYSGAGDLVFDADYNTFMVWMSGTLTVSTSPQYVSFGKTFATRPFFAALSSNAGTDFPGRWVSPWWLFRAAGPFFSNGFGAGTSLTQFVAHFNSTAPAATVSYMVFDSGVSE